MSQRQAGDSFLFIFILNSSAAKHDRRRIEDREERDKNKSNLF